MPGEDVLAYEVNVILKPRADTGKERVEHRPHRQNGGSGIDGPRIRGQGTHFSAGACVAFQHGDGKPRMRKAQRCSQPRDPGADNHNPVARFQRERV